MSYLFWAYIVIWALLAIYIGYLDFRQNKVEKQLKQLELAIKD